MIEELRRFILAANEGNMTRAAQAVFITQSAMTQSIQRLEKDIGAKLFVQKGKYLELTTDGHALKTMGEKILELWEKAKDPHLRDSYRPAITIGMFDNAAQRLAGFVRKNTPADKFTLEFVIDNSGKLLTNLQLGVIDISVLVKRNQPYPADIECVNTLEEELVPVAGRKFPGDIMDIPFILFNKNSNSRTQIDDIFIKAGIKPKVFAESTSPAFMKELAILGCGVALLPENLVRQELKDKMLVRQNLIITWKREYGIFVKKNSSLKHLTPVIKEMTKVLQGELK